TAVLLIWDLKQPKRFFYLLDPRKINKTSWLAIGGVFLGLGSAVAGVWFLIGAADLLGLADFTGWLSWLAWPAIPVGAMVAGYTAFLFGQAEGRDLWQSPVLFWHLLAQAAMVGAGVLLLVGAVIGTEAASMQWLAWALIVGVVAHLLITAVEFGGNHSTRNAQIAAHSITHGRYRLQFWGGSIFLTLVAGLLALPTALGGEIILAVLAGLLVQPALVLHERVFVMAAQDPPLS
ncbi:MAG: NrfD/PsrC family molybdoenzyme membrane anchor subunit, partial [Candidatus Nanopelagicales bacterium]